MTIDFTENELAFINASMNQVIRYIKQESGYPYADLVNETVAKLAQQIINKIYDNECQRRVNSGGD